MKFVLTIDTDCDVPIRYLQDTYGSKIRASFAGEAAVIAAKLATFLDGINYCVSNGQAEYVIEINGYIGELIALCHSPDFFEFVRCEDFFERGGNRTVTFSVAECAEYNF